MKHDKETCVMHVQDAEKHEVTAQIHVLICRDADGYVAQGLEVDYCATGATEEEVRSRFAEGLHRTVRSLIVRGRTMGALFKSHTPRDVWQEYMDGTEHHHLTCKTIVPLTEVPAGFPYHALAFCSRQATAHA